MDTYNRTPSSSWPLLQAGEVLRWEGRPAPRCYTFRQWRHALFGLVLTAICGIWMAMGVQQAAEQGWPWLAWVPLPFLGYALWLAAGQLIAARLEWPRVAYAVTDRRLILRRGLLSAREVSLPLERITWFRLQPSGEELGSLRVHGEAGDPVLILHCIEYPRRPAELLEQAIRSRES
ncbi:MAG: hypothetical protein FDZ69_02330 [Deltaproteobacteria bacterium]|nr:MAG: hypothetical protein FDZ69_02330 [Deltaproteobacteria bacterium]